MRGREILNRLRMPLLALVDQAAAVERLHIIGVERERLLELGHGLIVLAGMDQRLSLGGVALRLLDVGRADFRRWRGGGLRRGLLVGAERV